MKTIYTPWVLPVSAFLVFLPFYECKFSQNVQNTNALEKPPKQYLANNVNEKKESRVAKVKDELNFLAEESRKIVLQQCGSCHQKSQKSSKAAALAVFDLDEKIWYSRMSSERLGKLQNRILGSDKFNGKAKETIQKPVSLLQKKSE